MDTKKYEIEVDDFEHRTLVQTLSEKRNELILEGKSTEVINPLLLKAIDAKPVKKKKRSTQKNVIAAITACNSRFDSGYIQLMLVACPYFIS